MNRIIKIIPNIILKIPNKLEGTSIASLYLNFSLTTKNDLQGFKSIILMSLLRRKTSNLQTYLDRDYAVVKIGVLAAVS